MELPELEAFVEPRTLTVPVRGEALVISETSAENWLILRSIVDNDGDQGSRTDAELHAMVLGAETAKSLWSTLPRAEFNRVYVTAFWWQLGHDELAEDIWRGKAPTVPDESTDTNTDAEPSTSKPASSSSTNTRPKSKPRSRPKKPA